MVDTHIHMKPQATTTDHCPGCGLWLDPSWRACPTCGIRMAKSESIDRIERIGGIVALAGGVLVFISAFLSWDTTTGFTARTGMSGGRGIVPIIIGLVAIAIGGLALRRQRFGGNRATLICLGIFGLGFALFERRLIANHLTDIQFKDPTLRTSYGPGLWVLGLASIVLIVAGVLLPRQIERGIPEDPTKADGAPSAA